jgi:hypothetical protein
MKGIDSGAKAGVEAAGSAPVVYTTALSAYVVTQEYCDSTGGYIYAVKPSVLAKSGHHREGIVDELEAVRLAQAFEDSEISSEVSGFISSQ